MCKNHLILGQHLYKDLEGRDFTLYGGSRWRGKDNKSALSPTSRSQLREPESKPSEPSTEHGNLVRSAFPGSRRPFLVFALASSSSFSFSFRGFSDSRISFLKSCAASSTGLNPWSACRLESLHTTHTSSRWSRQKSLSFSECRPHRVSGDLWPLPFFKKASDRFFKAKLRGGSLFDDLLLHTGHSRVGFVLHHSVRHSLQKLWLQDRTTGFWKTSQQTGQQRSSSSPEDMFILMENPSRLYSVIQQDLPAANGIIHIIDRPITITLTDKAPRDERFADMTIGEILTKDDKFNRFLSLVDVSMSFWTSQVIGFIPK
ncbi:hypothetical protein EYF80_029085 [Liparis tanakae]|uniref:FAS1 domain-containing protein n=1 Tax=Liparis tanakae TaxID=230148 RepID=A0A4Z2H536_9TELE|nr:hypothetical protein EYF80_029085 [Liparis tanakae]